MPSVPNSPHLQRRRRRGGTMTYLAVALPIIGMAAALGIETVYLRQVQAELQGIADAASHAAVISLDGTADGMAEARLIAKDIAGSMTLQNKPYVLDDADIIFGTFDKDTGAFVATSDPQEVNALQLPLVEPHVGLGFGQAFFGRNSPVAACSALTSGNGDATTGTYGGPGLSNGHFDYDTTIGAGDCPGTTTCSGTAKHSHEYDDSFDLTSVDLFSDLAGHVPITDCMDPVKGTQQNCSSGGVRIIPDGTPFKIIVVNADLSPGAWLEINGLDYDVTDYDDAPFLTLPNHSLGGPLTSLSVNFDIDAIANCELHPTVTGAVRGNTPGAEGEWRNGALTIQIVTPTATSTSGTSNGDQDAVTTFSDGLLWEATYFWHWSGPEYSAAKAEEWQEKFDELDCGFPTFIDAAPGSGACGG